MPRYKKMDKKIYIRRRIFAIIVLFLMIFGIHRVILLISNITTNIISNMASEISESENETNTTITENIIEENTIEISSTLIEEENTDNWKIKLVNANNILPEDFKVELADIDSTRQFDKRAISELNQMMNDMRKSGITNVWVQSAYRSIEKQKEIFNRSVEKYIKQRKNRGGSRRINNEINK